MNKLLFLFTLSIFVCSFGQTNNNNLELNLETELSCNGQCEMIYYNTGELKSILKSTGQYSVKYGLDKDGFIISELFLDDGNPENENIFLPGTKTKIKGWVRHFASNFWEYYESGELESLDYYEYFNFEVTFDEFLNGNSGGENSRPLKNRKIYYKNGNVKVQETYSGFLMTSWTYYDEEYGYTKAKETYEDRFGFLKTRSDYITYPDKSEIYEFHRYSVDRFTAVNSKISSSYINIRGRNMPGWNAEVSYKGKTSKEMPAPFLFEDARDGITNIYEDGYLYQVQFHIAGYKIDLKTYEIQNRKDERVFYDAMIRTDNLPYGKRDEEEVNEYDLKSMVEVFLKDCRNNNISIVANNNIKATFESLDGDAIATSYGYNDDSMILLKVDPEMWANSSKEKRWYVLYHELGHDVLNLDHGEGGKMMFNFIDKEYTWKEFVTDRDYMFKSYLGD
jgi:hypothetical protein